MSQSPIIDKIRKLLATAGDTAASDNEIQSAVNIAKKLMTAHHLTEDDLAHEPKDDYQKVDEAKFGETRSFVGKTIALWENQLAGVVSAFVGCPAYIDNNKKPVRKNGLVQFGVDDEPLQAKSVVFYGVSEDASIAAQLYDDMRELIAAMAVGRTGKVYKSEGASYCQGFVLALHNKIKEAARLEMKAPGTGALIVLRSNDLIEYKKTKATQWLTKERDIKIRKGGKGAGSRVGFNREAFQQGRTDGANAEMVAERKMKLER
jgi:hypothetical protein